MKYLKLLFMAAMIFGLSACSGSSSYSPEKCKALAEKIKNHEELTESDYNEMIGQLGAVVKALDDKRQAIAGNEEAEKEFKNSEEAKEMLGTVLGFGIYLSAHEKDLTPDNQKRLEQVSKEIKELDFK